MYLDSLKLIIFSFSTNLDASLPRIGWYKTRLGTPIGNFGELSRLAFHNLIKGTSIGLHTIYVGETLYCIINQLEKSAKNINICISVCLTNSSRPSFKQPRTQIICWSFHIINLIVVFLQTLPCFRQKMLHILSTISNSFHLMRHHIHRQINQRLNIRLCLLDWHM